MSLRPVAAHWFELVTDHTELAQVMECLSRTGAVELEAQSRVADRLLFPGLDEELRAHHELARRYQHYWPAAAAGQQRAETLNDMLNTVKSRLADWARHADPLIVAIERLSQETVELGELRRSLQTAGSNLPDLHFLGGAGPKVQARLLMLPAGVLPHEIPTLALFKPWQTPEANYALVVGRPLDVSEIEAQLPALKAHVVPLPTWLPSSQPDALTTIENRLGALERQRDELNGQLAALSERLQVAQALGDIALIGWLNDHAKDLRGSERLAWVTGWTTDATGEQLHRALDTTKLRYILRLADAPEGLSPPLMLRNPGWARPFEVFACMFGTPGRNESDPSQILAVIASGIFGFMFGDIGQGALVLLAGLVLGRHIPLTRMLVPGGAMSVVFGVLFGSLFCREDILPALWLRPLDDPITILIAAIVAGIAVITLGLLLDAVQMHWRGETLHWWAQRAGLLAAYAGLLITPVRREGLLLTALGATWFILGAAALAKRGRLPDLVGASAEFVEQVLRLLVNTVSFARIGAFALAHAGLSVAIIDIAQASGRLGYWIVLVVGNVLVIALEGMVVSIQTTRLLLFEFFIRFLTGAGREFKPLPPPSITPPAAQEPNLRGLS